MVNLEKTIPPPSIKYTRKRPFTFLKKGTNKKNLAELRKKGFVENYGLNLTFYF